MMPNFPDTLELATVPIDAVDLALFAAAAGDHNPLHLDADVARAAGFERPVVHGMLSMAQVARLFTRRFGADALLSLSTRFTGVALRGERLHLSARLSQSDGVAANYVLRAVTDRGTEVVSGSARVRVARGPEA